MIIEQQQWSEKEGWTGRGEAPSLGETAQDAHLLGCSTAGEIIDTDVSRDTVAITALAFARTGVSVATAQPLVCGGRSSASLSRL